MTSTDLVLAGTPDEMGELEPLAMAEMVTHALIESKSWLAVATRNTDPTPIAEFKAWAACVAEMTKQKGLASEIQADAVEMLRRAERGIGVAIRNGQAAGEIRSAADTHRVGVNNRDRDVSDTSVPSPSAFAPRHELANTHGGIYDMTDGVTDTDFDEALAGARAEGNLSRANVVRKLKDEPTKSNSQRHELLRGTHRPNSRRIVEATVQAVALPSSTLELVDFAALPREDLPTWISSLSESISTLSALRKRLRTELEKELSND
jgi:hypothetical protein